MQQLLLMGLIFGVHPHMDEGAKPVEHPMGSVLGKASRDMFVIPGEGPDG